jgi:hypothetical protein
MIENHNEMTNNKNKIFIAMKHEMFTTKKSFENALKLYGIRNKAGMTTSYKKKFREFKKKGVYLPTLNVVYREGTNRFVTPESEIKLDKKRNKQRYTDVAKAKKLQISQLKPGIERKALALPKKKQISLLKTGIERKALALPKKKQISQLKMGIKYQQATIKFIKIRKGKEVQVHQPITIIINRGSNNDFRVSEDQFESFLNDLPNLSINDQFKKIFSYLYLFALEVVNIVNLPQSFSTYSNKGSVPAFRSMEIQLVKSETAKIGRGDNRRNIVLYDTHNRTRFIYKDDDSSYSDRQREDFFIENGCWLNSIMDCLNEAYNNKKWGQRKPPPPTIDLLLKIMGCISLEREDSEYESHVNKVIHNIQRKGLIFSDIIPILHHYHMGGMEIDSRSLKILNSHPRYNKSGYNEKLPKTLYFIKTFENGKAHIEIPGRDVFERLSKVLSSPGFNDRINAFTKPILSMKTIIPSVYSTFSDINKKKITCILGEKGSLLESLLYSDLFSGFTIKVICNEPLEVVANSLIHHNFRPNSVVGKLGIITNLEVSCLRDRTLLFQSIEQGQIHFDTVDEYETFMEVKAQFSSKVRCHKYQSSYNPTVRLVLDNIRGGFIGSNVKCESTTQFDTWNIDFNKEYPSVLKSLPFIPIINSFDHFVENDSDLICDHWLYIIQPKYNWNYFVYNDRTTALCFGLFLKHYGQYDIISVLKCRKTKNYIGRDIEELWDTGNNSMSMDMKKFILNSTIGINGKKNNSRNIGQLFYCKKAAYTYCEELKENNIFAIVLKVPDTNLFSVSCDFVGSNLINGFLLIHLMTLEGARHDLQMLTNKLKDKCHVISWKVDCVNIDKNSITFPELQYFLSDSISYDKDIKAFGKLKISDGIVLISPQNYRRMRLVQIPNPNILITTTRLPIPSENMFFDPLNYDKWHTEMFDIIYKNNRVRIEGLVPGTGKSSILKKTFKNVLFVCPTNALCENVLLDGTSAITVAHFFGSGLQSDGTERASDNVNPNFDISPFDAVVFDEIYLTHMADRERIFNWFTYGSLLGVRVYATGDTCQLSHFIDDEFTDAEIQHSVHSLFPNQIFLFRSKRGSTEIISKQIDDFALHFPHNDNTKSVKYVRSYFKNNIISYKTELKSLLIRNFQGIGNHSETRKIKTLLNLDTFRVGHEVIVSAGKRFKVGQVTFNTSTSAKCLFVDNNSVILKYGDKNVKLDKLKAEQNFNIHESRTCQSLQGMSKNFVCLLGWESQSAKWLYTAITRSRSLNNVFLVDYKCLPDDPSRLSWSIISSNLRKKLEEDIVFGRRCDYPITLTWLKHKYRKCNKCPLCKQTIYNILDIYIDRIRDLNHLGHDQDNSRLIHFQCNLSETNIPRNTLLSKLS